MHIRMFAVAAGAAAALALGAGSAGASINFTVTQIGNLNGPLLYGQSIIEDWDSPIAAGYAFTNPDVAGATYVRSGALGLDPGQSAPPPDGVGVYETSNYYTVTSNGGPHSAALTVLGGRSLSTFSFYLGSPDTYNYLDFYNNGALVGGLSGAAIWSGAAQEANGDQTWGRRVYYTFTGATVVDEVRFTSTGNSFEFDGLAATLAGVPEPATWTMMIMGFGGIGALLRRRRSATVFA